MKSSDEPSTSQQGSSSSQQGSSKSHQRPSTSKSTKNKEVDENAGPSPKNDEVVFKKPTLPQKSFGKRDVVNTEEEIRRVRKVLASVGPMDEVNEPTEQKKTESPPEPVKKQTGRKPRQSAKRVNKTEEPTTTTAPKRGRPLRQPNAEEAAQLEEMVRNNPTFIYLSAEETAHRLMNEVKKELKEEGVEQPKEKYKSALPPIPEIDEFDYRTLTRRTPDPTFRACFRWQKLGVVGEGVDLYFDMQNYTYQPQKRGPLTVDEAMNIWNDTEKELRYYMPKPVDHSYLFEWFDERDRKEEERQRKIDEEEKRIQKEKDNELYIEEQWNRILVEEGMDMDSGASGDIEVEPSNALNSDDEDFDSYEEPERTEEEERLYQIQYQQQLRVYAEAEEQQREYEAKMKRIEEDREREKQEEMAKEKRWEMLREQSRQQHQQQIQQLIEEAKQPRAVELPVQPPKFRTVAEKRGYFRR